MGEGRAEPIHAYFIRFLIREFNLRQTKLGCGVDQVMLMEWNSKLD